MSEIGLVGRLLPPGLAVPIGWTLTAVMGLLFVAGLVASIMAFLPASGGETRVLRAGARLGKGPHRTFSCALTPPLIEGIVTSVETAADGLSNSERKRALDRVATARQAAAGGDLPAALGAAADAIAVYRNSVVAARHDDTIRTTDDI